MKIGGMEIHVGLRCVGCGHVETPPQDRMYLLYPEHLHFACPKCKGTVWECVPACHDEVEE